MSSIPNASVKPQETVLEFLSEEEVLAAGQSSPLNSVPSSTESARANSAAGMSLPVNLNVASPMVREWMSKRREEIRPWGLFARTSHFQTPASLPKLSKRVYKNVDYFLSNYVLVFLVLFIYCLVTSPMLLVVLALSGGASYYLTLKQKERKLVLGGREVSLAQQYGLVGLCAIPLFLLAGAGSAVFWVIGASMVFIGVHASFYNYEALDIAEDQEPLTGEIVEEV
ncbi:hypothetical protein TCAL_04860 [Tigriopus californicus]|uniref:PRA1 family protein n=1 Tax=Tigriopus californicus TaxID=6832 RepID=A0A553PRS6_TIGCA|nr:prenylated Rab acceptor protein 1-like [Tigriopus californicus]XP_059097083.1 prenylated Rab acceptor protein 1-like [Tigriopus californicus]TRY80382.1 hypothetical protein TCAL_04860 [Tigriopus californicus]